MAGKSGGKTRKLVRRQKWPSPLDPSACLWGTTSLWNSTASHQSAQGMHVSTTPAVAGEGKEKTEDNGDLKKGAQMQHLLPLPPPLSFSPLGHHFAAQLAQSRHTDTLACIRAKEVGTGQKVGDKSWPRHKVTQSVASTECVQMYPSLFSLPLLSLLSKPLPRLPSPLFSFICPPLFTRMLACAKKPGPGE